MEQEPRDLDQALRRALGGAAPEPVHSRAQTRFGELAAQTGARSRAFPAAPGARWWWWLGSGLAGSAVAVAVLAFLVIAPSPSWAQVTAKFRALRSFSATVFVTDAAGQPPERIDVWVSADNRLRAHYRDLIFLGADGRIERVLSSSTGYAVSLAEVQSQVRSRETASEVQLPALATVENIARMSESAELSLDQLLALLRGRRDQLTPVALPAPELEQDLQIFDLASDRSSEWARLWVLRRLELPLRLRVWNAANAAQVDVLFDYTARLPDSAFDAAHVAGVLASATVPADRLFAGITDAGDRPLTPRALLATRQGVAMPEIDTVGRTAEGVVWVLSRHADNLRPDGEQVPGWDSLVDSLGQSYDHQLVGWLPAEQITLEFFVPRNLGADFKTPDAYTLQCRASSAGGARDGTVLASLPVQRWISRDLVPNLQQAARNQINGRTNWDLVALDEAADQLAWEDFEQIAAHIPGEPEQDPVALSRELKRLGSFIAQRRPDEAARLAARLYPLLTSARLRDDPLAGTAVCVHLAQLYRDGRRELAQRLANLQIEEALRRSRLDGPVFIVSLLVELRAAGLTEVESRTFLRRDLIDLPAVRERTQRMQLFEARPEAAAPGRS